MGRGRTATGMVCGSILMLAAGGWKLGDRVATREFHIFKNGTFIKVGDVGTIVGPCSLKELPATANKAELVCVDFGEGKRLNVNGKTQILAAAEHEKRAAEEKAAEEKSAEGMAQAMTASNLGACHNLPAIVDYHK